MDNIKTTVVNGRIRYSIKLSPGASVETSTLAELLQFIIDYGGNNVT